MSAKLIHTLLSRLGMPDDQYRQLLRDRFGVESSRGLKPIQQRELAKDLNALLPEGQPHAHRRRFENLGTREAQYATPAQLRMLEATWVERSRQPTIEEKRDVLNQFLLHRFKIGAIEWVLKVQVGKILKAIQHVDPDAPLRKAWTRSRRKPTVRPVHAPVGRLPEPTPTTTTEGA